MAMGSYLIGAKVRIPIQVTVDGKPYPGYTPIIEKIIKPNGSLVSGLPANATAIDSELSTYYYEYIPDVVGDYVVIIKNTINGEDYIALENFTVSRQLISAPRAEPR